MCKFVENAGEAKRIFEVSCYQLATIVNQKLIDWWPPKTSSKSLSMTINSSQSHKLMSRLTINILLAHILKDTTNFTLVL